MKALTQLSLVTLILIFAGCASNPAEGTGPKVWFKPDITEMQQLNQQFAKCRMTSNMGGTGLPFANAGLLATAIADGGRRKSVLHDCLISEGFLLVRRSMVPPGHPFIND